MNAEVLRFPFSVQRSAATFRTSRVRSADRLVHRYRCRPGVLIFRVDNKSPRGRIPLRVRSLRAVLAVGVNTNQIGYCIHGIRPSDVVFVVADGKRLAVAIRSAEGDWHRQRLDHRHASG